MEELWKLIPGFEYYECSTLGRVKRTNGNILKPSLKKSGYYYVTLSFGIPYKKCLRVHRLIALTFIPNENNKPTVNHINGIKTDNRTTNLEWATNKEQTKHAIENKLMFISGEESSVSRLKDSDILPICKLYEEGESKTSISEKFDVSRHTIKLIVNNKAWKHIKRDRVFQKKKKMRKGKKVTPEIIKTIKDLLSNNTPIKEIAEKYNITIGFVYNIRSGRYFSE